MSQNWEHIGWKGYIPQDVENTGQHGFELPWRVEKRDEMKLFVGRRDEPEYRRSLTNVLLHITRIPRHALVHPHSIGEYCIAERMRWAATRLTSRSEDIAYSLLGIFDVNMPLLYGEGGSKAFVRLQFEIIRKSTDHSIFAWPTVFPAMPPSGTMRYSVEDTWTTMLAQSPQQFRQFKTMQIDPLSNVYMFDDDIITQHNLDQARCSFTMTPRGMQIDCEAYPLSKTFCPGTYVVPLNCGTSGGECVIFLQELQHGMATRGDADYPYIIRILSEINHSIIRDAKLVPKRFCVQQKGFTDPGRRPQRALDQVKNTELRQDAESTMTLRTVGTR
jgi:hypothetical protein